MCNQTSKQRASGNTKYYKILGVSKNFSLEDLNKAYLIAEARCCRGGDPGELMESYRAYKILCDPEKRQLYDQYGEDAVKDLVDGVPCIVEFDPPKRLRQGKDLVFTLEVSLEDLYLGASKKLSLCRNVLCSMCRARGTKSGCSTKCFRCHGSGTMVSITITRLGPGMAKKMQSRCLKCNGVGELINDEDRCPSCKGNKVMTEKKALEVHVQKGMQIGHKITFPGQADQAPDTITGDIVFVLQRRILKDHPQVQANR